MILFLCWALTRLDECGVAQRVCVCQGPPESWLSESCFPPAEYIMSPLTGVWALMPASQLKSNTGKPARYERTSQLAARPLVKPSLTTSTLPLAQSLQTQTNHAEGKKGKQGEQGTSCHFYIARLSSHPPNHLIHGGNCCGGSLQGQSEVQE